MLLPENKFEIIAETAFSHEGDYKYLFSQVDCAKKGNADFVKFQVLINKEEYMTEFHPSYSLLDKWLIDRKIWKEIFEYSKLLGLKVIALPLNNSSLDFCFQFGHLIDGIEIHSVCFNEVNLLFELKKYDKLVILGVGGRLPEEIAFAEKVINADISRLILMFGFQSFPTDMKDLNLKRIKNFQRLFRCHMGYADHTGFDRVEFIQLNNYAYLLGARYFEKHVVPEKGTKRIDYETAIGSDDFLIMRDELNNLLTILGSDDIWNLNQKELAYRKREKKIVFSKSLSKDSVLTSKDLIYKISSEESEFEQSDKMRIIGKRLVTDVQKNEVVKIGQLGDV